MLVTSGHDALADMGIEDDATFRQALEDAADWAEFAVAVAESEPGPWRYQAACIGQGRLMFPERGESSEPARALCASCPVIDECREWADANEERPYHGFIAGESARQRVSRRAGQRREIRARSCEVCLEEFTPARNATICSSRCRNRKSKAA